MNLIEKGVMDSKDFIRTESFSLRLRPTGARKVTDEFNSLMNSKVEYRKKKKNFWKSVLLLKARKLSHQLVGRQAISRIYLMKLTGMILIKSGKSFRLRPTFAAASRRLDALVRRVDKI
ncbi:hypothetical protein [Methanococcoides alaskense]|uniref:Uncharacterized protein n=1 Tax=Methanococcoides alaskense TaxID=325778 RepID=A0AA90U184_9EURY|nr:hypothetical protein [Methanococcoides alaskense]MDA0525773.1 hypothetical protein [Methanococcoides alaskense]MDR6223438.1 hypothetical protein [Methanococcoides alaskense]